MKKLIYLFVGFFMIVSFISCEKQMTGSDDIMNNSEGTIKSAQVIIGESTPESENGIIPEIIDGANKGGNRTCAEVEVAWDLPEGYFYCGEKIDYDQDVMEFEGEFPEGLNVEVIDGTFISFNIDGCLEINGSNYRVGAVIVKGSNAANVYYYPGGEVSDAGLAAPGGGHMVSNLTFCFVECEDMNAILTLKAFYYNGDTRTWAATSGDYIFATTTTDWCHDGLGINYYPFSDPITLIDGNSYIEVGTVSIISNTASSLTLFVDLDDDLILEEIHVFLGSEEDFMLDLTSTGCPNYLSWESFAVLPMDNNATITINY